MTLVVLGDSIAFGQWVNAGWVALVARQTDELVVNLSVPGDTTRLALERYPEVRRYAPDTLLIALGLNDCNVWDSDGVPRVGPEAFAANLDDLAARAAHDGYRLILQVNHRTSRAEEYDARALRYNEIIRRAAWVRGVTCSDIEAEDIPTLDGIHPTAEGHERIAARVRAVL